MNNDLQSVSLLCQDSMIDGQSIYVPSHLKIGGTVLQNIECLGKLVISSPAKVYGNIKAKEVVIEGEFEGAIWASGTVSISNSAKVTGYISAGKLKVEKEAWCQFDACVDNGAANRFQHAQLHEPPKSLLKRGKKQAGKKPVKPSEPLNQTEYVPETTHETVETPVESEKSMADRFW